MTNSLPPRPSVENLKKQAKTLKRACLQRDPAALARVKQPNPQLADCQFVLACEYGFDSWQLLKASVAAANQNLQIRFVTTACLCYDDPHFDHRQFHASAYKTLQENPWLAEADIWCAATSGNAGALKKFLDEDPTRVNQPGPHGWTPLLCACYSRVKPTYESARLLLDRGADANAYTMKGNADERLDQHPRRYTALTGVFGGGPTGMANEPAHPEWRDLANLLLEHGANPADEQTLTIHQDRETTFGKLETLLAHGLKGPLTGIALSKAVLAGDTRSVALLLANRASTSELFRGKTPWQYAIDRGHLEIARLLENAGAHASELTELQRFVSLCIAGEEREVRAMLVRSPNLLDRAPKELVLKAVNSGRQKAVELALDLGFDPNIMDEVVALHSAAAGDDEEMVRLLIARGGSLKIREPFYDATPIGWADFFDNRRMRDMLLTEGDICIFDALTLNRLDRMPDIVARDPAALNRPFAKCITRERKPDDWQTPLDRMLAQGNEEAVQLLRSLGAQTSKAADNPPHR